VVPSKITGEQWDVAKRRLQNRANWDREKLKFLQQQFHLSNDELPGFLENFAQTVEGWRKESEARGPEPSEYPQRVLFSENGRLLFCATAKGLRIFDWEALLASDEESPAPRFRLDLEIQDFVPSAWKGEEIVEAWKKHASRKQGTILALAEDPRRNRLLFGTDSGKIGAVDLETGSERTLLNIPGETPVGEMGLSTDGTALYTTLRPDIGTIEPGPREAARFLVWDYTKIGAQFNPDSPRR
jgi:hypothetical protein